MAHPYHHALASVKKWGGEVSDYLPLHTWFDLPKSIAADFPHRALRHHAEGIFMLVIWTAKPALMFASTTGPCAISLTAPVAYGNHPRPRLRVAPQFGFPLWVVLRPSLARVPRRGSA